MRIAVISDVHANLDALEACLKKIDALKPDKIFCLGDMVDYCAQPNECIELLRKRVDLNIIGNHDEAQFNYECADEFNDYAYASSVHTRSVIKSEYIDYFKSLPYTHSFVREDSFGEDLFFVHGSPYDPENYNYVLTPEVAKYNFRQFIEKVCFIGHSHLPVIYEESGDEVNIVNAEDIKMGNRYIINVGSVGQPRDRDYRACFGLFDTEKFKFEYIRVDYDANTASKKILEEGLPEFLAERILIGV